MNRVAALCASVVVAVVASGCGAASSQEETAAPAPERLTFTDRGGCGDAYFWAASADGRHAVTVSVDVTDRDRSVPTVVEATLSDRADPTVEVVVEEGVRLDTLPCNDVVDGEVRTSTPVTQGRVVVTIEPSAPDAGSFASGTAELTGLVTPDGVALDDVTIETEMIGFYAG